MLLHLLNRFEPSYTCISVYLSVLFVKQVQESKLLLVFYKIYVVFILMILTRTRFQFVSNKCNIFFIFFYPRLNTYNLF